MPWLNGTLKFHIRLRTISLLIIHTQHTSLCSMNAILICVIVLVKMCFHMLNLCWFKYKKIFECFRYFWKVFCFYKNWKISKIVLSCFGDSVTGHPSRRLQLWARVLILATCSWVKGLVVRITQRFLRLSSRLPRRVDFPVSKNT